MKNLKIKQELVLLTMVLIPFAYLISIWGVLPEHMPVHFDINGTADRWGSKYAAFLLPVTSLIVYLTTICMPILDPKKVTWVFLTGKFFGYRIIGGAIMAFLSIVILHTSAYGSHLMEYMPCALFLLVATAGNFMINMKPNWFLLGVKTPWTMSNDEVWRKTNQLAGRLYFFGGLIGFVCSLFLFKTGTLNMLFISFVVFAFFFSVGYSFWLFKKIEGQKVNS